MIPLISNTKKEHAKMGATAKGTLLAVVSCILATGIGFTLNSLIEKNSLISFISLIVLSIFFLAFFLLQLVLVKEYGKINIFSLLYSGCVLISFYNQLSLTLVVSAAVLCLCLIWGSFSGKREMENLFKIRLKRIGKEALPKAIIGLAIFSSAAFYSNLDIVIREKKEQFISPAVFEKVLAPAVPAVKAFLPEFDFSLSIDQLADKLARNQAETNSQIKSLPTSTKKQVVVQLASDLKKQAASFFGGSYNKSAKLSSVIYQFLMQEIGMLSANMQSFVALAIALLVFLTVISISFILRWFTVGLAWIIYQIFIATGFFRIAVEGRSQEIAVLD